MTMSMDEIVAMFADLEKRVAALEAPGKAEAPAPAAPASAPATQAEPAQDTSAETE